MSAAYLDTWTCGTCGQQIPIAGGMIVASLLRHIENDGCGEPCAACKGSGSDLTRSAEQNIPCDVCRGSGRAVKPAKAVGA